MNLLIDSEIGSLSSACFKNSVLYTTTTIVDLVTAYGMSGVYHGQVDFPDLDIGETYTFSLEARRHSGTVNVYMGINDETSAYTKVGTATTAGWVQMSKTFVATADTAFMGIRFGQDKATNSTATGTSAYMGLVRHMQLEKGSVATAWAPYEQDFSEDGTVDDIRRIKLTDNTIHNFKDAEIRAKTGNAKLFYGVSDTAAATAEKVVACDDFSPADLVSGTTIIVKFGYTNSASVGSLLLNVNDTGAKGIRYIYNGSITTLPGANYIRVGQVYQFVYDGQYWVVHMMYNTNTTPTYLAHYNNIKARQEIVAQSLIVGDSTGYEKVGSGVTFDITYPIVWCTAKVTSGSSNYANMYLLNYDLNMQTGIKSGYTSTANKVQYLVTTIDGNVATIDSTIVTDALPTTDDGKVYIELGKLGNQSTGANYFILYPSHHFWWYKSGKVRPYGDYGNAVITNKGNSVYTNIASAYVGATGSNSYWKITIPNIATKWTIISLYINVQQAYANGRSGTIIISGYHNSTAPYTWSGLSYSLSGYLTNGIKVYASDGNTIYIGGLTTGYFNLDIDKVLVADAARGVDISGTTIERVAELPETYVEASFRQNAYVGDIGSGLATTFAYSKTGLDSTSWLAAWNAYELRAISPSKITAGNVSGTVAIGHGGTGATTAANARTNLGLGTASVADLSTATDSTSTTTAATSSAVKTAYDLANSANTTANTALSGVNGNLIYDHTFTISNGVATFTPHVYQKGVEVTTNYAKSCFTWKYRLIDGSEVTLTTKNDRGCDVTITNLGYGGHVIGIFTPA